MSHTLLCLFDVLTLYTYMSKEVSSSLHHLFVLVIERVFQNVYDLGSFYKKNEILDNSVRG